MNSSAISGRRTFTIVYGIALIAVAPPLRAAPNEAATSLVTQIQRADYEGDRGKLKTLHDELLPLVKDEKIASRVQYWRGFAMWRRAINGFNDSVDPKELEQDLNQALDDFKDSSAKAPDFADAKIAMVSCYGNLAFINRKDQARVQELIGQSSPLVKELKTVAPDNPRFLWVLGPILWNIPPDRGGGQDKAIENYRRGLESIKKQTRSTDPLEPSWGEPELLMNLAWSDLNQATPDLDAAERNARAALALVPYWHYVRDILLPQIIAAKAKLSAH
jgi:hypothetical protein